MVTKPINLVIVMSQLRMGGAERAVLKLAVPLQAQGYHIKLVSFTQDVDFYQLPAGIERIELDLDRRAPTVLHTLYNTLLRVFVLRKALVKAAPDVILTLLPINDILTSLALLGTGLPQVISTRVYPSVHSERAALSFLKRIFYPLAKHIVSVSTGVDQFYSWISPDKRTVIGNLPSDVSQGAADSTSIGLDPKKHYIVSIGRFVPDKNFALLINAFSRIAAQNLDWNLLLIGDGALKSSLEAQAQTLGLAERVLLPGRSHNPFPILKAADLFVLPSDYEGVPNVVLEAMACHLPVITSDYFGEARDIITDGENGLIVPRNDPEAMAAAIQRLISDKDFAQKLADNGLAFVQTMNTEQIIQAWDTVFRNVVKQAS